MNTKDLKRRITSVKETAKITNAVHLISAAKMCRARENFDNSNRFLDNSRIAARYLMSSAEAITHPLFKHTQGNRVAYVVIGGDKGLCGDYNQLIINASDSSMKGKTITVLFAVGNTIKDYYDKKEGIDVNNSYVHIFPDPMPEDARAIGDDLCDDFENGKMDKAYVIYTLADKLSSQKIVIKQILPLDILPQDSEKPILSCNDSFEKILRQYVWARIYQAISSASLAENYKRMMSMQEATTNAENIIEELQKKYNLERQESITNALLDATISHMGRKL